MAITGIISGSPALRDIMFADFEERSIETVYGPTEIYLGDGLAFLARHGNPGRPYILPHRINHPANMAALKEAGVERLFALNSVGSLKAEFKPGMFAVPSDFIMIEQAPLVMRYQDSRDHIVPELDESLQEELIRATFSVGFSEAIPKCVYWQTSGPRLETRAEIRFMAPFADLVGMTMASEAIAAAATGIPYASLCSIDNYANGILPQRLTVEAITEASKGQRGAVVRILNRLLGREP